MKKFFAMIIILLSLSSCIFAADQYEHYMVGYVDSSTDFTVSIYDEVLPFDLESSEVAFNSEMVFSSEGNEIHEDPSKSIVHGLRVGEYTLFSNGTFNFTVTHTKLELEGTSTDTNASHTLTSIDYRLYLVKDGSFVSCRNSACRNDGSIVFSGTGGCSYVNQSIYVSLDEGSADATNTAINQLKNGNYKSTVTFVLTGM